MFCYCTIDIVLDGRWKTLNYNTRIYFPSGSYIDISIDGNKKLAKNFTVSEFANKLAQENIKLELYPESFQFISCLQKMRDKVGTMNLSSAYRTKSFNLKCGGDNNSAHKYTCAIDWKKPKLTNAEYKNYANIWKSILSENNIIGACNYYTNGMHLEAFSNRWYQSTTFKIRDYRGTKKDW